MNATNTTQEAQEPAQSVSVTMPLPKPLLTTNATSSMNWAQKGRHVAAQRTMAKMYAKQQLPPDFVPLVGRVRLDVAVCPYPMQKEPDAGGKWQAVKAWEDGLQDAGVFAGGDDKVVVYGDCEWRRWERTGQVTLTLTEVR